MSVLINHTFDKTAGILGYQPGLWGEEDLYITVDTTPCRIRMLSGSAGGAGGERFAGGKLTVIATHRVYISVRTITERDRLMIDGIEYEIVAVNQPSESKHLEIDVLRIQ